MAPRGAGKGLFAAIGAGIGAGTAISAIAGTYKFSEFLVKAKKLHKVGPENAVFQRLLERVHSDLQETRRLVKLPAVEFALSASPEKVAWINSVMKSVRGALERMSPFTEKVAGDTKHGGHVGVRHRSLTQVLGFLVSMEPLACCEPGKAELLSQRQVKEREVDVEFEGKRGGKDIRIEKREIRREGEPKEMRFERREVRREGPPQAVQYRTEVRREGGPGPQDFEYQAEHRRGVPPQDFQYQGEVRREGPLRGQGAPRDIRYQAETRRDGYGGHEEWIEQREVSWIDYTLSLSNWLMKQKIRRDQKDYYTPDPRDVPRMSTWPRSRL
jgi:hypothetical protein